MSYISELNQIRKENAGVLRPADVVAFAKNPRTKLHEKFTWDDNEAAREYRLWQARELIRVVVSVGPVDEKPVRTYVSLLSDRRNAGGGYRTLHSVLRSKAKREALLREAEADMNRFIAKYELLKELAGVFEAMRAAKRRHKVVA